MAIKKRAVAPTFGKSSTEKKVAAVRAAEFEIGAVDTKKAMAEPKVAKPVINNPIKKKAEEKVEEPKAETKKAAAKKPATKKAATKKTTAKKTETKAAAEKKTTAKKATKTTEKKTAAKATTKKAAKVEKFELQFNGKNVTVDDISAILTGIYAEQGKKASYIKKAQFYIKPEESKVYYVVNDTETGDFFI